MDKICDANYLYKAFNRSVSTSRWKASTQRAQHDCLSYICDLQRDIWELNYKTCKQPQFIIHERGKTRVISGNTIRDRTVRHVMCDDVLMPSIQKYLIYDNAASQEGKGVDFARRRLRCHLQKYYRKHGNNGYILLIDFSKYYDNVLHSIAFDQLVRHTTDHKEVMVLVDIVLCKKD